MDHVDQEIMQLLQDDGRISFSALGRRVGLSTNAAAARVRRLERDGVIAGYTTVLGERAPRPTGALEVFIDVRLNADTDDDTFADSIAPLRQIVDAVHMTGAYDYLLHAYVADTSALDALLRTLKKACGAAQTQTRVALRNRGADRYVRRAEEGAR